MLKKEDEYKFKNFHIRILIRNRIIFICNNVFVFLYENFQFFSSLSFFRIDLNIDFLFLYFVFLLLIIVIIDLIIIMII